MLRCAYAKTAREFLYHNAITIFVLYGAKKNAVRRKALFVRRTHPSAKIIINKNIILVNGTFSTRASYYIYCMWCRYSTAMTLGVVKNWLPKDATMYDPKSELSTFHNIKKCITCMTKILKNFKYSWFSQIATAIIMYDIYL